MTRHEFLVRVIIEAVGVEEGELDRLKRAESDRAAELAAAGHLLRLWRPTGPVWANVGLWSAASEEQLHDLFDTLPLRPYMSITIEPLTIHPNDPGRGDESSVGDVGNERRAVLP